MEHTQKNTKSAHSDDTHLFRWGYSDTKFVIKDNGCVEVTGSRYPICGYEMPYLIPFVEDVLNLPFIYELREEKQVKVPKPKIQKPFLDSLKKYKDKISTDDVVRLQHSVGQTTADEVMQVVYKGTMKKVADLVFFPQSEKDIEDLIKLAIKHKLCLVPYGGGTSVSCSLSLPTSEKRTIVVVNMTSLTKVLSIDKENNTVQVEAGIKGEVLEEYLNSQGYTLGHEPDSIEFSTVGGWISTNASGMKKNRYGNIEDIVLNYTLVTPKGKLQILSEHSRMSSGLNLHKAMIGSEGNFGFITQATMKIYKLPAIQEYQSLVFPDFETGVKFLKSLQDEGEFKPASIRLVDNFQFRFGRALRKRDDSGTAKIKKIIQNFFLTKIKKLDLSKMVAATIVFEGSKEEILGQKSLIARLAKEQGGFFAGGGNGKSGYKLTFAIAYIRDFMSDHFILGETYETTVPWNKIMAVCEEVDKVTKKLHKKYKFPGNCYISPRISQLYQTGVCIYFTHGLCFHGVKDAEEKFSALEKEIRKTIMDFGGSISHHHGIGKIRAKFADRLYTKETKQVLLSLKKDIDPNNIMGIQNNIFTKSTT